MPIRACCTAEGRRALGGLVSPALCYRNWGRRGVSPPGAAEPALDRRDPGRPLAAAPLRGLPTRPSSARDEPHPTREREAFSDRCEPHRSRRPCHPHATSSGHQRYPAVSHVTPKGSLSGLFAPDQRERSRPKLHGMKVVKACIGLAVPGRPIGPWSRRTGAPEASTTRRDRNPDAHEIAHGTRHDTPG
jgi:hypothetical protein